MKTDLHTHTVASGHAFGTVLENVRVAKEKGISLLGITDHGPALPGSANHVYFRCARRIPPSIEGVRVLFGVEANILDEKGRLDLPDEVLAGLDFVMAGLHPDCGYEDRGLEKNTQALIRAMSHPHVKMVPHPYNPQFPVDMEEVTKFAVVNSILLEINGSFFFKNRIEEPEVWQGLQTMTRILKENNQKILVNSDAHSPFEVGKFEEVLAKAGDLGLTEDDFLNNDEEAVLERLGHK